MPDPQQVPPSIEDPKISEELADLAEHVARCPHCASTSCAGADGSSGCAAPTPG